MSLSVAIIIPPGAKPAVAKKISATQWVDINVNHASDPSYQEVSLTFHHTVPFEKLEAIAAAVNDALASVQLVQPQEIAA